MAEEKKNNGEAQEPQVENRKNGIWRTRLTWAGIGAAIGTGATVLIQWLRGRKQQ